MTQLLAKLKDSHSQPLKGYIQVKLDYLVVDQVTDEAYLPVAVKVPLVNGQATLNLEPSETSLVTYLFEIYQQITDAATATTTDSLVWSFRAKVPDSATPVPLFDLIQNTGITHDALDASFSSIIRRLYLSDDFWVRFQTQVLQTKGIYSPQAFYQRGNVVSYDGSSYVYINTLTTQGVNPKDTEHWQLMASKGELGAGTSGNNSPYDPLAWKGQLDAPSRNAVTAIIETLATKAALETKVSAVDALLTRPKKTNDLAITDRSSELVSSAWVQQVVDVVKKAITPVGLVSPYAGTSAPTGWVFCDGRLLDRVTYAGLFTVLGTAYNIGGEATTSFRVPDLRGRVVAGLDLMNATSGAALRLNTSWANTVGGAGGADKHKLDATELPSHSHKIPLVRTMREALGYGLSLAQTFADRVLVSQENPAANPESVSDSFGGNVPHNNVQPTIVLSYIIYVGL